MTHKFPHIKMQDSTPLKDVDCVMLVEESYLFHTCVLNFFKSAQKYNCNFRTNPKIFAFSRIFMTLEDVFVSPWYMRHIPGLLSRSPEKSTTVHSSPQQSTTVYTIPQQSTTVPNSPQQSTTVPNSPQESTVVHNSSQRSTTDHSSPQKSRAVQSSPQSRIVHSWGLGGGGGDLQFVWLVNISYFCENKPL